jgi:predicted peroxiredoxin
MERALMPDKTEKTKQWLGALDMVKRGIPVFPLKQGGATPILKGWQQAATTDITQINTWWSDNPYYNIGVKTGDGTLVVDIDTKGGKPGLKSLGYMEEVLGLPEDGFRVQTRSGGFHIYARTDRALRQRIGDVKDLPGVDIKCEGGYVVGPGSFIGEAGYRVCQEGDFVKLPEFLEDTIGDRKTRDHKDQDPLIELDLPVQVERCIDYLKNRAPEAIAFHSGDRTTFGVAARVKDFGISRELAFDLISEHWNEAGKADPPWSPGELLKLIDNAFDYAKDNPPGVDQSAALEFDAVDLDAVEKDPEVVKARKKSSLLQLLSPTDMLNMPEPEWLVDGLLQVKTNNLAFGKSNTFKSFIGIDIACCIANGVKWHGKAVKKKKAMYVATEGANGVGRFRIPEWHRHHGIDFATADIFLYPKEIKLDDTAEVKKLIATVKEYGIEFVVLDIFGGTMNGSETEDVTARAWVTGANALVREAGAATLVIAHTGWMDQTRARMHTHFWGSFDTRLKIEGDKDKRTSILSVDRHKDADSTGRWGFRMTISGNSLVPELDPDVLEEGDKPAKEKTRRMGQPDAALNALRDLMESEGVKPAFEGAPNVVGVPLGAWRDECCELFGGVEASGRTTDKARQAFSRTRRGLIEEGTIRIRDGFVFLRDDLDHEMPPEIEDDEYE